MEEYNYYNKQKLVEELQSLLNQWINDGPHCRSIAHLSRATGVSDSTLRRLYNSKIKITDDSIFKIISHISSENTYDGIIAKLVRFPEIVTWFSRTYAYLKKNPAMNEYKHSNIAEIITSNSHSLAVYSLISVGKNLTADKIRDAFGAIGIYELEKLILAQIISYDSNNYLTVAESNLMITKEHVANILPDFTKMFFKRDHVYNGRVFVIESVSKEGYMKLSDALDKYIAEVSSITATHTGEVPVIVAGFTDTLTTTPYFEVLPNETLN